MKKLLCIILVLAVSLVSVNVAVVAKTVDRAPSALYLRAGGGSGSGGSGGGSGSSGGGTHTASGGRSSLLGNIFQIILFAFVSCSSAVLFHYRLSKRSRKAKKLMKQMRTSDNAWKFKSIEKTVEESFYAIQNAWSALDMTPAVQYMSQELFENYQTKLNWMRFRNQKNVLEKIRLLRALPVAVHDDADNSRDHVWFYIKGRMVDYIIDTDTFKIISGSTLPTAFVEYWQFVRRDDEWVLNKILQKNEADQIAFCD